MTRYELSRIMKRAWVIRRTTGKTLAVCLSLSWQLYRLTKSMREGAVRFAYEKTDGTLRRATGTLVLPGSVTVKGTGAEVSSTFRYYDLDRQGFRCFRVENFVTRY